ncbi:MAG: lysylphosphatidylglycerol synthase transmembrane domain-containing protein [Polyangia bacterium]
MPAERRSRLRLALQVLSAAVLIGLAALLFENVQWREFGAALARASWPLVLAAAALNFVNLACKTARWRVLLGGRVAYWRLYHYLVTSYAASAVLPARAGEALRVVLLRRRDGLPLSDAVGPLVVEKLFEVLGLLVIVLPLPFVMPLPHWARLSIEVIAVGGLSSLVVAVVLARVLGRAESSRWHALASGLSSMRSPMPIALAALYSVLAYAVDAAMVWLVLRALSIHVPWATPALVLLGGNLAIAVPSTPGQLGALEAGIIAGLSVVGVPLSDALAFGLVYHLMQLLPVVLVGATGLRLVADVKDELATPAEASSR